MLIKKEFVVLDNAISAFFDECKLLPESVILYSAKGKYVLDVERSNCSQKELNDDLDEIDEVSDTLFNKSFEDYIAFVNERTENMILEFTNHAYVKPSK